MAWQRYSWSNRVCIRLAVLAFVCLMIQLAWIKLKVPNLYNTLYDNDSNCIQQVQNIMFLKIHKTGGSTLTNVLNRFADKRDLAVAIPRGDVHSFYWPKRFQLDYAHTSNYPSILCNHARFNKRPLNLLFPKQRTKYVTLIREPASQFESTFYFFQFSRLLGANANEQVTMEQFLTRPISFPDWQKLIDKRSEILTLSRNPQMFDLGFDFQFYQNLTAVNDYVRFLDNEFDLVLILEDFDESLVLMKRLFCWEIEDILYIKHMERLKTDKNREIITDDVERKILSWNKADSLLYNYFRELLWARIRNEGPGFYDDLKVFRDELRRVEDKCIEVPQKTVAYGQRYVRGYRMKANMALEGRASCGKMLINEIGYLDYFKDKAALNADKEKTGDEIGWERSLDLAHSIGPENNDEKTAISTRQKNQGEQNGPTEASVGSGNPVVYSRTEVV